MLVKTVARSLLPVALLLGSLATLAQQTAIPDTPAGHTLQAWLDAFNSGDRAKIENYVKTIDPTQDTDGLIDFRGHTGGFDLLSIASSEPLHIVFRVKEKNSDTTAIGDLVVKDGHPPTVVTFGLRAIPPGVTPVNVVLDAALRQRVIDGIKADLTEYYIDAGVAAKMNDALDTHVKAGDYNSITDGNIFAEKLTSDLRAISHDGHLRVGFSPFKLPPPHEPTADDRARMREQMLSDNCAFDKVEILPGNIGYVKFDGFMDADICGPTVAAAMAFVAHTDALIFDLRENGGGQPSMVSLIASYLFDQPTHLNDLYNRHENTTTQYWTLAWVPGERMTTQPVYVLTSHRTFSGGEEFTYDLKTQKRATIVGEITGGGAHPVSGHPVADYFMIGVPFATAINPITKTSWEGTGVEPDVKVAAAAALTTAEKLAADKIHAAKAAGQLPPTVKRVMDGPAPQPPPPPPSPQ
ncbi:MAG TPA: S41 family peptidase [Acidobacteriaceae bacterium]|nr:S41 family peptidase [Acidobacteriaceae bacterium]